VLPERLLRRLELLGAKDGIFYLACLFCFETRPRLTLREGCMGEWNVEKGAKKMHIGKQVPVFRSELIMFSHSRRGRGWMGKKCRLWLEGEIRKRDGNFLSLQCARTAGGQMEIVKMECYCFVAKR
jgi:hypothetical protein